VIKIPTQSPAASTRKSSRRACRVCSWICAPSMNAANAIEPSSMDLALARNPKANRRPSSKKAPKCSTSCWRPVSGRSAAGTIVNITKVNARPIALKRTNCPKSLMFLSSRGGDRSIGPDHFQNRSSSYPSLGAASIACQPIVMTQVGSSSAVICHNTAFAGRLSMSQWR
jgi:hypothetical protein